MKKEQILQELVSKTKCNSIMLGSMYILPNGELLYLGDSGYGHSSVSDYLYDSGVEIDYTIGKASKLLKSLNWIRLNTNLKFIELNSIIPTDKQIERLHESLVYMINDISINVKSKTKVFKDTKSQEIINFILHNYELT